MEWVCYACNRRYKIQPDYCQCGSLQFKMIEGNQKKSKKSRR